MNGRVVVDSMYARDQITRQHLAYGIDMQGMDWGQLHLSRALSRQLRLSQLQSHRTSFKIACDPVLTDGDYYRFHNTQLNVKCHISHFQLRNLLYATSRHNVFYTEEDGIYRWNTICRSKEMILDRRKIPSIEPIKVTCLSVAQDVLFVGGMHGDYVCKRTNSGLNGPYQTKQITSDIINYVDIIDGRHGALSALVCANDHMVSCLDLQTFQKSTEFLFPHAINCAVQSPDRHLLCAVGDSTTVIILNQQDQTVVAELKDHQDFMFACRWSLDGRWLATGSDDGTTRIYDVRMLQKCLRTLSASATTVKSIRFSHDHTFMAVAEDSDFVHIYDTHHWRRSQVIDLFGNLGGISFSPEDDALFIVNADIDAFGGLMTFERAWATADAINWLY